MLQAAWVPGLERVRAVRQAIGDSIDLMVDCHGRMETSEAISVGQELSRLGLMWYEEPVGRNHPDQLQLITQRVEMPTAAGEAAFCESRRRRVAPAGCRAGEVRKPRGIEPEGGVQSRLGRRALQRADEAGRIARGIIRRSF